MDITPKDVIKVLEGCINFLEVELLTEALSPSTEMAREENTDRLRQFVKKLQNMKNFAPPSNNSPNLRQSGTSSAIMNKIWKSENKAGLSHRISQDTGRNKKEAEKSDDSSKNSSSSDLPPPPIDLLNDAVEDEDYEVPDGAAPVMIEEENYEVLPAVSDSKKEGDDSSCSSDIGSLDELQQKVKTLEKYSPQEMKSKAIYSGFLRKHKKRILTQWHKRFCVLVNEFLFYYKSETDKKEQGYIILPGYTVTIPPKDKGFVFVLESEDKSRDCYSFQADSIDDAENWQRYLQAATSMKLTSSQISVINQNATDSGSSDGSGSAKVDDVCENNTSPDLVIEEDLYDDVGGIATSGDTTSGTTIQCDDIYDDVSAIPASPQTPKPPTPITTTFSPGHIPPRSSGDGGALPIPTAGIPPRPSINQKTVLPPPRSSFAIDNIYMGMFNCTADDEQDLAFIRGDVMYILDKIDTHWWLGYLNGKVGLVPSNHLTTAFVN